MAPDLDHRDGATESGAASEVAPTADGRDHRISTDLTPEQLEGMDMWDRDPAVFQERSRPIWAMLVRSAIAEIRRSRAIAIRLRELALSLEHAYHPDMRKIGAELRSRINGL